MLWIVELKMLEEMFEVCFFSVKLFGVLFDRLMFLMYEVNLIVDKIVCE